MVRRIFVEKKSGFDVVDQGLLKEIKENLGIRRASSLRIINRYDVENVQDEAFKIAKSTVFSEPNLDIVYDETLEIMPGSFSFGVEYLPGQYDQRADSAIQCIKLISDEPDVNVRYAKIFIIEGDLTDNDKRAIKKYCINPVDSREASFEKPKTLGMNLPEPQPVETIPDFRIMKEGDLRSLISEMGLAMSYDDISFVQEYFRETEYRSPTITELKVIDTYWSDHCRHTTFLTTLNDISYENGEYAEMIKDAFDEYIQTRQKVYGEDTDRPICFMDLATIGTKYLKKEGKLDDLDESDEINACSIKVKAKLLDIDENGNETPRDEDWLVMFKNETHNHPTEIEPFGGAATCLGGAIRDPLSGRVYVYQAMRVTGSGDPNTPISETLPGKLSQYQITKGAAKGYSSYGNQIGLATGLVDEIYDEGYIAKRMEIGAVIGAAPASHVIRETPVPGDVILIVGGRTGRDGIGGATGSSKVHTEESIVNAGAEVQKGNPPVERNIQRLFRRREAASLIKKCNDFGAGGVSVAIGELADSIDINLDKVLKKYDGLDGTELAISESQERMAVVISRDNAEEFIKYALEENLEATLAAKVTDTGRFRMMWKGDTILDLSRKFLDSNGVCPTRTVMVKNREFPQVGGFASADLTENVNGESLLGILSSLHVCSRRGLAENFDSTIGSGSVLMPLGGKNQLTPALGMAAKLPITTGDTDTVSLMAYGFNPAMAKQSPFHDAMYSVLDSITKIVAMGGEMSGIRLTFQEYFQKLGKVPTRWALPLMSLLGALKVQLALELPAIGGKDSMSGTFNHLDVPPTLVSFAVGITEADRVISPELKGCGNHIVLLSLDKDEKLIPDFNHFKSNMSIVSKLISEGKILSSSTIGQGGIFAEISKMALGNGIGVRLTDLNNKELITASPGSLILEIPGTEDLSLLFEGNDYRLIGETVDSNVVEIRMAASTEKDVNLKYSNESIILKLSEIRHQWGAGLEKVFPVYLKTDEEDIVVNKITYEKRNECSPKIKVTKPCAFVPVFPGTNCEMDTKRALEKAGADVKLLNLINLNKEQLDESITQMAEAIKASQMIVIPGGFSGGDEPEGSAKFITAVFRNPRIEEAVIDLLDNRYGLMLGICNGFQALIKLGLVPYGKIVLPTKDAPTLTYNTIGRHISRLVNTRVASTLSPWFAAAEIDDIHTMPVSHGEGRFVADNETIESLITNGQIATQYVDMNGNPTMDINFNPNGSLLAIEGITSPDGRVLGKMGHSERVGKNLYKNVPGNYDSKLFESGVKYFK